MNRITLPCPRCSGDGTDTVDDRHARTRMDVCPACGGEGVIDAGTGERRESSASPATGLPFGEDSPASEPQGGGGGWA